MSILCSLFYAHHWRCALNEIVHQYYQSGAFFPEDLFGLLYDNQGAGLSVFQHGALIRDACPYQSSIFLRWILYLLDPQRALEVIDFEYILRKPFRFQCNFLWCGLVGVGHKNSSVLTYYPSSARCSQISVRHPEYHVSATITFFDDSRQRSISWVGARNFSENVPVHCKLRYLQMILDMLRQTSK